MRRRVLLAYERAERSHDAAERDALLTFVVIGGGPTGLELAGALGEMAHLTLRGNFRSIDLTARGWTSNARRTRATRWR